MTTTLEKLSSFCDPGITAEVLQATMDYVVERIKRNAYGPDSEAIHPEGQVFVRYVSDKWWYPLSKWRDQFIGTGDYKAASTMSGEEILDMMSEFINSTMREEENCG